MSESRGPGENTGQRPGSSNLLPPWQPGVAPNPGGRPKTKPISDAYRRMLDLTLPPQVLAKLGKQFAAVGDRKACDLIALGMGLAAAKGSAFAAAEIADRVEGKVPQALTDADGGNLRLSPAELVGEIVELARLARMRHSIDAEAAE